MGQKVNSNSLRLGYIRGWESSWFTDKKTFAKNLCEDNSIRKCLFDYFSKEIISKSVINRTLKTIKLTIYSSKPGALIGPGGEKLAKFTKILKKICKGEVQINVSEVRNTGLDAYLVGVGISTQIKSYMPYKRVIRHAMSSAMSAGARGIKICISGRLAGAEIARREKYDQGRMPLHTLRADIDYACIRCKTPYGIIGIKVWIFKKYVYGKRDLSLNVEVRAKQNVYNRPPFKKK